MKSFSLVQVIILSLILFANYSHSSSFNVGPVGGLLGKEFVDKLPDSQRICGINIRYGNRIDAIQLKVLDDFGNTFFKNKHGGNRGSLTFFSLGPTEYIKKIEGFYNRRRSNRVFGLRFHTNLKISPWYGTQSGRYFVFDAPTGYSIQGIGGYSGDELDALSAFIRKN
ncbi:jacalin-like lectin [Agarilytica rhodophyticola]|uniref:jacalin-like lectin n=1 Tax=Agarilytica rhodophyticola TaxID=1737490 RepID=UPI000B34207E|nr:jacalin-like lectin [Agarilytica rhodophyticola]